MIVIHGRLRALVDGGCSLEIDAHAKRWEKAFVRASAAFWAAVVVLTFAACGVVVVLIGLAFPGLVLLLDEAVRRVHKGAERDEERLLREWVAVLAGDLSATPAKS